MTATKISLQAVVGAICDSLADLAPEDQTRALEAVRLTLGLGEAIARPAWGSPVLTREARVPMALPSASVQVDLVETELSAPYDPALLQEKPAKRLPTVVVQMVGDRPMVVGQQVARPGRTVVVVGPPRVQRQQLGEAPAQAPCRGGYVRPRR